jgi:ABC-type multidrug transport system ATPase subunit
VAQNLHFLASVYRIPRAIAVRGSTGSSPISGSQPVPICEVGDLEPNAKKRVALAATLVPEIVLLDKPTTGVDPLILRDICPLLNFAR